MNNFSIWSENVKTTKVFLIPRSVVVKVGYLDGWVLVTPGYLDRLVLRGTWMGNEW